MPSSGPRPEDDRPDPCFRQRVEEDAMRRTALVPSLIATSLALAAPLAPGFAAVSPEPDAAQCEQLARHHIDQQAGPRAALLAAICSGRAPELPPELPRPEGIRRSIEAFGGSDINLVTGTETLPMVTQAGSSVGGHGDEIVAVYNDTLDAPLSYSGISVSVDGGANFTRLSPDPFTTVFAGDAGSPAVAWDELGATWTAAVLSTACGGQGIGLMSSSTPADPASWVAEPCAHTGTADDRPILWIDNNPASAFYGRRYLAFNDFAAGGALKLLYFDAGTWNEVVVTPSFIRNVHLTGSRGADGTIFVFGMNEGGGAGNSRSNMVYRSITGGATWTAVAPGPSYPAAGAGLCAASNYFYMVPPNWRTMGWGQGAVGPGGVVHYVWARAGQVPGDLGDIYYIRSADNGLSWSSPQPLNTDQAAQNNVVQWLPSITVTSQGYVLATWYDRRNTTDGLEYEIYGRLSLDNGATFLDDEPLSAVVIPQPTQVDSNLSFCFGGDSNLASPLGNASLVTWTDGRNAVDDVQQMDVYLRQVPLCPAIGLAPGSLPIGELTIAYAETLTASGGTGPYAFTLSGSLPPGITLDPATGDLTGTPSAAGTFPFSVIAADSFECTGSLDYHLVIQPTACPAISIAPTTLPSVTQGAPYSQTLVASGGVGPYAYEVTAGALPEGLALDPATGEISGSPVESGTYVFDVTATDAGLCAGTRTYSLQVLCPTITLSPPTQLPDAFAGVPYLTNITANGGTEPYTFEITNGTLHNGIYMGEGGTVFGVTEGPGTKIFQVQATDANGCTGGQSFRMDSRNCFAGAILCDEMSDVAQNFTATDLCGAGAEWYGTNACPSSNDVGHTPTAHARWGTNGNCFDYGAGMTQDALDSFPLDVSNCNSGEVLLRFNYLLGLEDDATSDRARVEVVVDGGPPQVVADSGAGGPSCTGNPSPGLGNLRNWSGWQHLDLVVPATTSFQVRFVGETDDGTDNAGEGFLVDDVIVQCVCPDDYVLTPEELPQAFIDTAYSVTIVPEGGAPPYTFGTLPGNPPPAGLGLDPVTGELFGIPTTAGIFPFTIVATDSNFCKTSLIYNLLVSPNNCPVIGLEPPVLPDGVEGEFYSVVVMANGGIAPYTYQVTTGALPPGLALDPASGVLSGTPNAAGIFSFTLSVIDDTFCLASWDYTVVVTPTGCPEISISPTVLPNPILGELYSETLLASGGAAPYLWFLTAGALPNGLLIDQATGEISGRALESGSFAFSVTAQDSALCAGTQPLTLDILDTMPFVDGFESGDTSAWSSTVP